MKKIILLVIAIVSLQSCVKTNDPLPSFVGISQADDIITDSNLYTHAPSDSFKILNAQVTGSQLEIKVEYGGGCGNANFKLIAAEELLKSTPPQRSIRLSLDDQDKCKKLIVKDLIFDLTSAQASGYTTLILQLKEWKNSLPYQY